MCKRFFYLVSFVLVLGLVSNAGGQIASNPAPADGSDHEDNWAALGWTAGAGAASHNIYFGDNLADVQDGTGGTFRGNQTETALLVGLPDSPYPQGLVRGTTYYWRIDEIEADGTVRTGQVWSFTVIGPTARHPNPPDAGRFVDPNVELSWSAGLHAVMHYVYFGENLADVEAGTGDTYKGMVATTAYTPGPLEMGKTYFWRVDEYDGSDTHKGDIWKFTTRPVIPIFDPNLVGWWKLDDEGTGTIIDYSGYNHDGTLHGDTHFVEGYDADGLEFDGDGDYVTIDDYSGVVGDGTNTPPFSIALWVRTTENVTKAMVCWGATGNGNRVEFRVQGNRLRIHCGAGNVQSDTPVINDGEWHHVVATIAANSTYADGVNFYVDGEPDLRTTTDSDPIHVIAGNTVNFGQRYNRNNNHWFSGTLDDIRIYDKVLTPEEVQKAMQGDPRMAWDPRPPDKSEPFIEDAILSWTPGITAAKHDAYFGTSEMAVADADITDTTGIYRGRQDSNSYTPAETLEFGETYYWRIDEIEADGTTIFRGRIWSFTIADFIVVDDFEAYDANDNQIWYAWRDGLGYGSPDIPPYYAGNGTGSAVGDETTASYTEESIVNGGLQSMPLLFDNNKPDKMKYSEATKTLSSVRDWTKHGVKALSLWFRGHPMSASSFTEAPAGTYTMTARSVGNISGQSDEFHFAYKQLNGAGTIIAKVDSLRRTHNNAHAGVMIRDTLDPNSAHAMVAVTPRNGVRFRRRDMTAGGSTSTEQAGIAAPQWVKITRDMGGSITASYSADGITWTDLGTGEVIPMNTPMYIGLVVASNHAQRTCEVVFSNVQITGASGQWMTQDVGISSNDPEPLYVAIANSGGTPAVVHHPDPNAARINTWTEWNIDFKEFEDQGVNLNNVDTIHIGLGDRDNPQPGGAGQMFFDDIRLYRPRCMVELLKPQADLNDDCAVNGLDLEMMATDWLESDSAVSTTVPDPAGLVVHYKFDGNANDSSGNNYHGKENGGPSYVAGKFDQAHSFDGFDDYVAIPDVNYASTGHTEVSVCAWIRTSTGTNEKIIASFDRDEYWRLTIGGVTATDVGGPGLVGWHVMTMTDGTETQLDYASAGRVDDGQWHHVAGTFNNGTSTIYIDGNPETPALGGPTFGTGLVRYGFVGSGSEAQDMFDGMITATYFEGDLDEVRIYHRALSAAEIRYLADDTPGDGELYAPVASIANLSNEEPPLSRSVNLKDFAVLADSWLEEQLWPQP